jgi:signal transduction histidine kinase
LSQLSAFAAVVTASGVADPGRGSGLIGLIDRVEALGGKLSVVSPLGAGTALRIRLPRSPSTG